MTKYKTCTKCSQSLPLHQFGLRYGKPLARCRQCIRDYKKEWERQNPEKLARYSQTYHAKNPNLKSEWNRNWRKKNAEHRSEYLKKYREDNKETIAYKSKLRRNRNIEAARRRAREFQKKNPELFRKHSAKRRATLNTVDVRIVTQKDLLKMLSKSCAYCNEPSEHIDHIIPLSRGGRHSIGNLTGACKPCNLSKGSKFITEWRKGKNAA